MANGHRRIDLQRLAENKLTDAGLLLAHGSASNAYYLAGYAIELGLKACIAKQISAETLPDRAFINKIYTHSLQDLVKQAGLLSELKTEQDQNPQFQAYWGLAGDWNPEVRYASTERLMAELMIQAVGDPKDGILRWIQTVW
jgi:hypothetical protein